MTAQVLAFYLIGGLLAIVGVICGCVGGFSASEWWLIGVGVLCAVVGVLVQFGILNPPLSKEK